MRHPSAWDAESRDPGHGCPDAGPGSQRNFSREKPGALRVSGADAPFTSAAAPRLPGSPNGEWRRETPVSSGHRALITTTVVRDIEVK